VIDIILALCQFSFTIAQITFTLTALQKNIGTDINRWYFAIGIICLYTPLAWVRKIQYFSAGYIIGNLMIILTVSVVSIYAIVKIKKDGVGPEFQAVNDAKMWDMVGFSFYCFEGIGVVMPIMEQSRDKE
jgi:amino acid permease